MDIEVRDDDVIGSKHMCKGTIKVSALTINGGFDEWFDLQKKGKAEGKLHLRSEWFPVKTEEPVEENEKKHLKDLIKKKDTPESGEEEKEIPLAVEEELPKAVEEEIPEVKEPETIVPEVKEPETIVPEVVEPTVDEVEPDQIDKDSDDEA